MGAVYDDLPGHEGYATRDQRDRGWTARCSCGWSDDHLHTADGDEGYDAAVERWDTLHANPLLERAVPAEIGELVAELRRAVSTLAAVRPLAAGAAVDELERWQRAVRARSGGVSSRAPTIQERLDALATRSARADRRLER